jgi:hypothetical protein
MTESEMNSPSDLAEQISALQRQVFTLLLALIVVSGTLVAYLGYESHRIGKDIRTINTQVVEPYRQKLPAIQNFLNQLNAYANAHPDFRPILVKYGLLTATNAPKK